MDKVKLRNMLIGAVNEVFEKMYFIFLEVMENAEICGEALQVAVSFSEPGTGRITGSFPPALAEEMVSNALGLKTAEITDQIQRDCLKECMNMVGGAFLQRLYPEAIFRMSLPFFPMEKPTGPAGSASGENIRVAFDAGHKTGLVMELAISAIQSPQNPQY
ncbi:MAG: chemotaxis protein CheX [Syntrophales bacterium]|nr:chemotaxis protein CheX [Syntrophales bacterium]